MPDALEEMVVRLEHYVKRVFPLGIVHEALAAQYLLVGQINVEGMVRLAVLDNVLDLSLPLAVIYHPQGAKLVGVDASGLVFFDEGPRTDQGTSIIFKFAREIKFGVELLQDVAPSGGHRQPTGRAFFQFGIAMFADAVAPAALMNWGVHVVGANRALELIQDPCVLFEGEF